MNTQKIVSKNAAYQKFEVLKTNRNKRYKYGEFFVEGVRNINCALKKGWTVASLLYSGDAVLSSWAKDILSTVKTEVNYVLTGELMNEISDKVDSSELLAIVKMREDDFSKTNFTQNPVLALFDRPSNKGNLGTIIRSCDALGVEGLIITGHAVDLYDPGVIVSTMGSFFNVPVIRMPDNQGVTNFIDEMKEKYPGFQTIGTTAHEKHPIYHAELGGPILFMIGNETDGLCHYFQDSCDQLVTIPMAKTSFATSFNVGCAATVMFYEASRQRAK